RVVLVTEAAPGAGEFPLAAAPATVATEEDGAEISRRSSREISAKLSTLLPSRSRWVAAFSSASSESPQTVTAPVSPRLALTRTRFVSNVGGGGGGCAEWCDVGLKFGGGNFTANKFCNHRLDEGGGWKGSPEDTQHSSSEEDSSVSGSEPDRDGGAPNLAVAFSSACGTDSAQMVTADDAHESRLRADVADGGVGDCCGRGRCVIARPSGRRLLWVHEIFTDGSPDLDDGVFILNRGLILLAARLLFVFVFSVFFFIVVVVDIDVNRDGDADLHVHRGLDQVQFQQAKLLAEVAAQNLELGFDQDLALLSLERLLVVLLGLLSLILVIALRIVLVIAGFSLGSCATLTRHLPLTSAHQLSIGASPATEFSNLKHLRAVFKEQPQHWLFRAERASLSESARKIGAARCRTDPLQLVAATKRLGAAGAHLAALHPRFVASRILQSVFYRQVHSVAWLINCVVLRQHYTACTAAAVNSNTAGAELPTLIDIVRSPALQGNFQAAFDASVDRPVFVAELLQRIAISTAEAATPGSAIIKLGANYPFPWPAELVELAVFAVTNSVTQSAGSSIGLVLKPVPVEKSFGLSVQSELRSAGLQKDLKLHFTHFLLGFARLKFVSRHHIFFLRFFFFIFFKRQLFDVVWKLPLSIPGRGSFQRVVNVRNVRSDRKAGGPLFPRRYSADLGLQAVSERVNPVFTVRDPNLIIVLQRESVGYLLTGLSKDALNEALYARSQLEQGMPDGDLHSLKVDKASHSKQSTYRQRSRQLPRLGVVEQDGFDHRLQRFALEDDSDRTKGRPGKSSAPPEVLLHVWHQTAEVNRWQRASVVVCPSAPRHIRSAGMSAGTVSTSIFSVLTIRPMLDATSTSLLIWRWAPSTDEDRRARGRRRSQARSGAFRRGGDDASAQQEAVVLDNADESDVSVAKVHKAGESDQGDDLPDGVENLLQLGSVQALHGVVLDHRLDAPTCMVIAAPTARFMARPSIISAAGYSGNMPTVSTRSTVQCCDLLIMPPCDASGIVTRVGFSCRPSTPTDGVACRRRCCCCCWMAAVADRCRRPRRSIRARPLLASEPSLPSNVVHVNDNGGGDADEQRVLDVENQQVHFELTAANLVDKLQSFRDDVEAAGVPGAQVGVPVRQHLVMEQPGDNVGFHGAHKSAPMSSMSRFGTWPMAWAPSMITLMPRLRHRAVSSFTGIRQAVVLHVLARLQRQLKLRFGRLPGLRSSHPDGDVGPGVDEHLGAGRLQGQQPAQNVGHSDGDILQKGALLRPHPKAPGDGLQAAVVQIHLAESNELVGERLELFERSSVPPERAIVQHEDATASHVGKVLLKHRPAELSGLELAGSRTLSTSVQVKHCLMTPFQSAMLGSRRPIAKMLSAIRGRTNKQLSFNLRFLALAVISEVTILLASPFQEDHTDAACIAWLPICSPIGQRSDTAQHHQLRLIYTSASSLQRIAASLRGSSLERSGRKIQCPIDLGKLVVTANELHNILRCDSPVERTGASDQRYSWPRPGPALESDALVRRPLEQTPDKVAESGARGSTRGAAALMRRFALPRPVEVDRHRQLCSFLQAAEFGRPMLEQHFPHVARRGVLMLNNGSFGVAPKSVLDCKLRLTEEFESFADEFVRLRQVDLNYSSLEAIARRLRVRPQQCALLENVTIGVSNILRRLLALEPPGSQVLINSWTYIADGCYGGREAPEAKLQLPLKSGEDVLRAELTALCRSRGIKVIIDGAHAIGQVPNLDIEDIGADFYLGNLNKWHFLPKSVALMWISEAHVSTMKPDIVSWLLHDEVLPHRYSYLGTRDTSSFYVIPEAL
uniref:ANK_REP_REGION domain-containing protein n=1 Tax=Macrostomum lignano TaxID=282301 RepID=A0A1I8HBC0_9PLAT